MKITRRQLRKIISEAMYDPMHGIKSLEEPYKSKIMSVLDNPDSSPEDRTQFHQLADTIGDYKDPRPGMPDDSMAGVKRQQEGYLKQAAQQIETYLPGFLNLPQDVIDVVVEFVFLSDYIELHIQLDEDTLEMEIGEDAYRKATHYEEKTKPENAKIAAVVEDYRRNSKAHDVKFYYIYTVHGRYQGIDPFSRIDPHGIGDPQTGFHDGFREEYQKVTTNRSHKVMSTKAEESFIKMIRDLRPDAKEYVIN